MNRRRFLQYARLPEWLTALSRRGRLLVPREEGGSVVYRLYAEGDGPMTPVDSTASPKAAILPASRELFRFEKTRDPECPERQELRLVPDTGGGMVQERKGEPTAAVSPAEGRARDGEPTIVFGARPCGVGGFAVLDRIYQGESHPDPYYKAAREDTLFITIACDHPENTCFCHWVGGGPDDPTGSDILMTPVRDGYFLEAFSERGRGLMEDPMLREAEDKSEEAASVMARSRKILGEAPDISGAPESILAVFSDMGFWEDVSAKCLSCGACTYLCPTCYCFNITDESNGLSGKRLRSWDTCMSFQFCLEASGHNPRPTKAHRLRNRIGHKFSYYPKFHYGLIACRGCGRCIKSCPVSLDIREIVLKAIEHAGNGIQKVSNG